MPEENGTRRVMGEDFDYDPISPVPPRSRIMQLLYNDYVESGEEYNKIRGSDQPIPQWKQEREDHTFGPNEDGTFPRRYNNLNLGWFAKEGKQVGTFQKCGRGGVPHRLGMAFDALGLVINPRKPEAAGLLGHWFDCGQEVVQMGPYEKKVWFPVFYHGAEKPDTTDSSGKERDTTLVTAAEDSW